MGYDGLYKGKLRAGSHPGSLWMPGCIMHELSPADMPSTPLHPERYLQSDPNLLLGERGRKRAINKQCK